MWAALRFLRLSLSASSLALLASLSFDLAGLAITETEEHRARRLVERPCAARAPSSPSCRRALHAPPLSLRPNSMHTTRDEDDDGGSNEVGCEGIWI